MTVTTRRRPARAKSAQAHAPSLADLADPLYVTPGQPTGRNVALGYDAADNWTGRRKQPVVTIATEDDILPQPKRDKMGAAGQDLARNFALTAWMIRRHLDYVAAFELHATHEDRTLGDELEGLVAEWSEPESFDRSGRHDRDRYVRLAEARAVIDGDFGTLRLADGTVQGMEADRIRNPHPAVNYPTTPDQYGNRWQNGVYCDEAGKALAYQIHRRRAWRFEPEAVVPAADMHLHGYFERYEQARGISPLASALAPFRDCYEAIDLALAKAKVSQLFAMAILRDADSAAGELTKTGKKKYDVDFGKGPVLLDLEPGEDAKFLGENSPSPAFKEFLQTVLIIGLKALDIPYSFYDESHTNFFGSRGAWLHYERAARSKRANVLRLLNRWKEWRLVTAIARREWIPPAGYTLAQLLKPLQFVPVGMPWWKPTEELRGDLDAIGAGLSNPERVARERNGGDVYENLRITARVTEFAKGLGLPVNYGTAAQQTINVQTAQE